MTVGSPEEIRPGDLDILQFRSFIFFTDSLCTIKQVSSSTELTPALFFLTFFIPEITVFLDHLSRNLSAHVFQ
jgi:hypothetical protein